MNAIQEKTPTMIDRGPGIDPEFDPPGIVSDGIVSDGIVSDGIVSDGIVSDGIVSDGIVSDGIVSDGIVSDGIVSDGIVSDEHKPQVRIRPYAPGDFPAMHTVWIEADLHPFTEIELGRLLNAGGGALVAETVAPTGETAVVGTLLWSHNGQSAWLWKLAVAQPFRHQGIARRLLRQVEQDAAAIGLSGVALLTRETNTAAQGLYTREGWKKSAIHQFWGKRLTGSAANAKPQKESTEC